MKTKASLFISLSILGMSLIISCKNSVKTDATPVKQFLSNFNRAIKAGNPDTIMAYFDMDYNKIQTVFGILQGGHGSTFQSYPLFAFSMDMGNSKITYNSTNEANVDIPIKFMHDSIETKHSILTISLSVSDPKNIKIIKLSGAKFLSDYIAYENLVKSHKLKDVDIYAPITLASFKVASELKAKFDSVIWFEHVNQKTYYFVTNGSWSIEHDFTDDSARTYKMGLLSPDLKIIVPVEYDLIHNVNGTFNGLIEVEKAHKHGFYDLTGKNIVAVIYDQIFPVNDSDNLAALRQGDGYYWLRKDLTISGKEDLNIADVVTHLKQASSFTMTNSDTNNLIEFNSRNNPGSIYIAPSFLVDLNILPPIKQFKNPLRKNIIYDDVSEKYNVKLNANNNYSDDNFFKTAIYSIRDYFLGGRSEFYDRANITILDKKRNRVFSHDIGIDYTENGSDRPVTCGDYVFKPINDSLFEIKLTANVEIILPGEDDDYLKEAPAYHYLYITNNKLIEKDCDRVFAFTKFVKMDDTYLQGCYSYSKERTGYLKPQYLRYMKNEIFADYHYKFKDSTWREVFSDEMGRYRPDNENVNDSLTEIDKYNINWINQKLKIANAKKLASN